LAIWKKEGILINFLRREAILLEGKRWAPALLLGRGKFIHYSGK
jgi:hypothetical protein